MKKKSIARRLIPWLITAVLLGLLVYFVIIPLYVTEKTDNLEEPVVYYFEGEDETITLENDSLLFELDSMTTHFELTDKATGTVWYSNPPKADKDKLAGTTQKNNLQSTIIITYSQEKSVDKSFENFSTSINKGLYSIEKVDDTTVRITYTLTDLERIYTIPYAFTAERYSAYRGEMSGKDRKKFEGYYTKYTADKFSKLSEDEKEDMLKKYPTLGTTDMYLLKSEGFKRTQYTDCEALMAKYGYNEEEFLIDQANVAQQDTASKLVFNVAIEYKLDGEDFVVSVPYEKMRYRSANVITSVNVLPMFGAAGTDETGFLFVPEGGGALIEFNNGKDKQNAYYADMYGWDYALKRDEVVSETRCDFPVFGISKANGAFICIIEEGSAFGGIQADISLRNHSYNFVNAKYHVLHSDEYNVSAKTEAIVKMIEQRIPTETVTQRYCFVDSSDYVDMAKAYGEYLEKNESALSQGVDNAEMPVTVEMVGAISKTVIKLGAPVDSAAPVTRFDEAEEIIGDLKEAGVQNMSVRFSGWMNEGVNQQVMSKIKVVKELGGEEDMKNLIAYAEEANVPLYFDGISCFAYNTEAFDGFSAFTDAARYTTREQVKLDTYSYIIYRPVDWKDEFYLVKPAFAYQMAGNLIEKLDEADAYGVAFRDIGNLLSADYNTRDNVTREEVKVLNIQTLKDAQDAGQSIMLKRGFEFTLPYADVITDMDFTGTEYTILDQQVPFYQIAIHGLVNYTGAPINIAADWETELLDCAQYGAGLNFTVMAEEGTVVQETWHSGLYGASYGDWADDVKKIISDYQTAMAGLNAEKIVDHEILTSDVTVTTYENGRKVYVNYGRNEFIAPDAVVPARSYVVSGGENG